MRFYGSSCSPHRWPSLTISPASGNIPRSPAGSRWESQRGPGATKASGRPNVPQKLEAAPALLTRGDRRLLAWIEEVGLRDELLRFNLDWIDRWLEQPYQGLHFADDWGTKTGLMFSPAMWRRFIKPRLAIIYQHCQQAGVVVGQHSDGAVELLFPDLIEIGLQVFNPLSPSVMDPDTMKDKYGDRLTFYGGIDVETTLPLGTPEEVREEIRTRAATIGRGGGYILQSSHTMLEDVPMENIVAYVEEVRRMAGMD